MRTITSKRKGQKGFTLVEAMVAIAILSISITGPLIIAQKGVASAIYSRDQVTAFYLAQEAVEYIRNVRDSNPNKTVPLSWPLSLDRCAQACAIDARFAPFDESGNLNASSVFAVTPGSEPFISIDKSSGLYGYTAVSGWTPTPTLFKRTISVSVPTNGTDRELLVSVKVSWNTTLFTPQKEFTVKEILFKI